DQVNMDSECPCEQGSAEMCRRTDAAVRKFYALTRLLRPGNKPGKRVCCKGLSPGEDRHAVIDEANAGQILLHIERRFGEERYVCGNRRLVNEERISVQRRACEGAGPDQRAATPDILVDYYI